MLAKRLRELERAGVIRVEVVGHAKRYLLTAAGAELAGIVMTLGEWGARWLDIAPADRDPYLALWTWTRLIRVDSLPAGPAMQAGDFAVRGDPLLVRALPDWGGISTFGGVPRATLAG